MDPRAATSRTRALAVHRLMRRPSCSENGIVRIPLKWMCGWFRVIHMSPIAQPKGRSS
jgi:hypothetical protein